MVSVVRWVVSFGLMLLFAGVMAISLRRVPEVPEDGPEASGR